MLRCGIHGSHVVKLVVYDSDSRYAAMDSVDSFVRQDLTVGLGQRGRKEVIAASTLVPKYEVAVPSADLRKDGMCVLDMQV